MPSDKAPVDAVGGPQDEGPWPSEVEEIAVDRRLQRPVTLSDGSRGEAEVTVTSVQELVRESGEKTDGYAVTYKFDDPALGGDS